MSNLILIGFKSAGKTTLGRLIGAKLGKPFLDIDELFPLPPSIFYRKVGEKAFRAYEKQLLKKALLLSGHVIATGGGAVLDSDHHALMRSSGLVIHLQTPKQLVKQRIFSSSIPAFLEGEDPEAAFEKVYKSRLTIYTAVAHHNAATEDEVWEIIRSDPFFKSPPGESPTALPLEL